MGRRVPVVIGIILIVSLLATAFWPGQSQPRYRGRKLGEWVVRLGTPRSTGENDQQAQASEAIRAIGSNAAPFLIKWIAYEPPRSRRAFYRSLREIGIAFPYRNLSRLETRSANAVTALFYLGPAAHTAIPDLNRIMTNSPFYDCSMRARDALALTGEPALPYLFAALTNQWPYRHEIPLTLAGMLTTGINSRGAVPLLVATLNGSDVAAAGNAARALGTFGRYEVELDSVLAALVGATHHPAPKLRSQAVLALAEMANRQSVAASALAEAVADPDIEVATYACTSLAILPAQAEIAVPALMQRLDPRDSTRARIRMEALARFGPKASAAAPLLLKIMNEAEVASVAMGASNALRQIAPETLRK